MSATIKVWANGIAPTCEDDDLNGFKSENNNLIVGSGQSLSTTDNEQTHKAVAHYAGVGDFYVDSGTANTYVLSTTGSQISPPTYASGMRIRFVAGNTNTGASTVNVAGLGVKDLIRDDDGAALEPGDISTGETRAYYDGTSFRVTTNILIASKVRATYSVSGTLTQFSLIIVPFDTVTFDTGGEFTTGAASRFTANTAGYYKICASVGVTLTPIAGDGLSIFVYKNGVLYSRQTTELALATGMHKTMNISEIVSLNGSTDYIDIRYHHTSSNTVSWSTDNIVTFVTINRLP